MFVAQISKLHSVVESLEPVHSSVANSAFTWESRHEEEILHTSDPPSSSYESFSESYQASDQHQPHLSCLVDLPILQLESSTATGIGCQGVGGASGVNVEGSAACYTNQDSFECGLERVDLSDQGPFDSDADNELEKMATVWVLVKIAQGLVWPF